MGIGLIAIPPGDNVRPMITRKPFAETGSIVAAEPRPSPPSGRGEGIPAWQKELGRAISSLDELLALLELRPEDLGEGAGLEGARSAHGDFPLRVPRGFVARMRRGDPRDPLLLQVLPQAAERQEFPGFDQRDPLEEAGAAALPGLLHKYQGRVLLVLTGACAVHCRYCFRRHFPYAEQRPDWHAALDYVAADSSIEEVLLSGGDPLSLSDDKLGPLARSLAAIPHVRRLRVHSRLPVVLPERVDARLLEWLAGTRLQPVMVLHANHANEIDESVAQAVARLRGAGVTVLNQAVLLRGVNDLAEIQRDLNMSLFQAGVLPYYLHLLDRVQGAGQFGVEGDTAHSLYQALLRTLPGYLVPRMVREVPGFSSKVPISSFMPPASD
jgi:EF-P beta-lysylation protein EpmB